MNSALWAPICPIQSSPFLLPPVAHTPVTLPVHSSHFLVSYTGLVHSTSPIHFYSTRTALRSSTPATVPSPFFNSSVATSRRTPSLHFDGYPLTFALYATFCVSGSFLLSVSWSEGFPGSLSLSLSLSLSRFVYKDRTWPRDVRGLAGQLDNQASPLPPVTIFSFLSFGFLCLIFWLIRGGKKKVMEKITWQAASVLFGWPIECWFYGWSM
jgi:hypothetical protein